MNAFDQVRSATRLSHNLSSLPTLDTPTCSQPSPPVLALYLTILFDGHISPVFYHTHRRCSHTQLVCAVNSTQSSYAEKSMKYTNIFEQ